MPHSTSKLTPAYNLCNQTRNELLSSPYITTSLPLRNQKLHKASIMPKFELTPATDLEEVMWESIAPEGPHETLLKLVAPVAAAAIAIAGVQGQGRAAQQGAGEEWRWRKGRLGFAIEC